MERNYYRGDIYMCDLGDGIGSEQEGFHPIVIIQNNIGNEHSPTVIVAAVTSKIKDKALLPTHCLLQTNCGLDFPSVATLEQLRTVDKSRLGNYIGRITVKQRDELDKSLAVSVDLDRLIGGQKSE